MSDSEIQLISETAFNQSRRPTNTTFSCAFCSRSLDKLDLFARREHYELHLTGESSDDGERRANDFQNATLDAPYSALVGKVKQAQNLRKKTDVFWHHTQSTSPPSNYTPGLIPLLKKALWTSHAQGATQRAALCYEGTVHISHELWDRGWGCGYRNFLMACTALVDQSSQPMYFPLLDTPIPPGVENLQVSIEDAWRAGFDQAGAKDLRNLVGTRKWIGTADLWVAFSFRGIPAELVDFDLKNQLCGVELVSDWIVNYFSPKLTPSKPSNVNDALQGASPIIITDRMPLILQYDGHSRTIVGYEISKAGKLNLLMFDPSTRVNQKTRNAALSLHHSRISATSGQCPPEHAGFLLMEETSSSRKRASDNLPSFSCHGGKRIRAILPNGENEVDENENEVTFVNEIRPKPTTRRHDKAAKARTDEGDLNPYQILTQFKLNNKKLKKKEYQILYFPLTPPLTQVEKIRRKVVVSMKAS